MTKYSITLTASAETLFGILAKLLPIDDLHVHVEEHVEKPKPIARIAQQVALGKSAAAIRDEIKHFPKPRKKRRNGRLDLKTGINAILLAALSDGKPVTANTMRPLVEAGGYSENSVGSRLQALREHGVVTQNGDGTWQLKTGAIA